MAVPHSRRADANVEERMIHARFAAALFVERSGSDITLSTILLIDAMVMELAGRSGIAVRNGVTPRELAMTEVCFEGIKGCLGLAGRAGPLAVFAAVAFDEVWKPIRDCTNKCEDVFTAARLHHVFQDVIRKIQDTIAMNMIVFPLTYTEVMHLELETVTKSKLKHAYYIKLRLLRDLGNQLLGMGAEPTNSHCHRSEKARAAREREHEPKDTAPLDIEPSLPSLPLHPAIEEPLGIDAIGTDPPHGTCYSF
jgi:hypothetical protein